MLDWNFAAVQKYIFRIYFSLLLTSFPMLGAGFWTHLRALREYFCAAFRAFLCCLEISDVQRLQAFKCLLTYKKKVAIFWKSSIADAGDWTQASPHRSRTVCHWTNSACLNMLDLLVKVIYTQRSLRDRNAPKGILGRLAFFNNYYWKIASLRLAIFSGTPGNFWT